MSDNASERIEWHVYVNRYDDGRRPDELGFRRRESWKPAPTVEEAFNGWSAENAEYLGSWEEFAAERDSIELDLGRQGYPAELIRDVGREEFLAVLKGQNSE